MEEVKFKICNTTNRVLKIVSEIPEYSNQCLQPGQVCRIKYELPSGYRSFVKEYLGKGKQPTIFIGMVLEEAGFEEIVEDEYY